MSAPENPEESIALFLKEKLFLGKKDLSNNESLVMSGILDSVSHLQLVRFLEKKFKISVKIEEFRPENFDTLEKIARFTERKLAAGK